MASRLTRYSGVISPSAAFPKRRVWLDWARAPIGTGPYRIRESVPTAI